MTKVRQLIPSDVLTDLEMIVKGKDIVVVAVNSNHEIVGKVAARRMPLIHSFNISPTITGAERRLIAERLIAYIIGLGVGLGESQALLAIDGDNLPMLQFVKDIGATPYRRPNDQLFLFDLE